MSSEKPKGFELRQAMQRSIEAADTRHAIECFREPAQGVPPDDLQIRWTWGSSTEGFNEFCEELASIIKGDWVKLCKEVRYNAAARQAAADTRVLTLLTKP